MPKDRDTPIPIGVNKSHSKRISDLEKGQREIVEGQGKLAGDIGNVSARVKTLEEEYLERTSDRPSDAQFSLSPTRMRAKFQNISAIAVVTVVVVIALMFVVIAWIVGK